MALKEKQNDGLSVLIGCETRWGTTFDMTSRFLKLWVSFAKLAAKTSPAISSALRGYLVELVGNVPLFSCFVDFWKPFHELQTKLQAERYPTAGHVIPSLLNAASNSQNWIPPCISAAAVAGVTIQDQALTALLPEYAEIINTISVSITVKLKEGFATAARACRYWNDMVLVKIKPEILDVNYFPMELRYATILTPIFKKLPFLNEDDRAQWYAAIGDLIEKNTIRRSSLTGFLISALPPYPDPESELCQYLSLQPTADDADEEQFWFDTHSVKFEVLPKLFKRFCCIPATSAPSERFFSLTGLVCTKRRANLKSETIEKIALCNKNIKSILGAGLPDPLEVWPFYGKCTKYVSSELFWSKADLYARWSSGWLASRECDSDSFEKLCMDVDEFSEKIRIGEGKKLGYLCWASGIKDDWYKDRMVKWWNI